MESKFVAQCLLRGGGVIMEQDVLFKKAAWPPRRYNTSSRFAKLLESCELCIDGNYSTHHVVDIITDSASCLYGRCNDDMAGYQAPSTGVLAYSRGLIWRYAFWVGCVLKDNYLHRDIADGKPSWDTGLIGGVLTMSGFQHSFNLDKNSSDYANLSGNIVSVLQGGCFFGAMSSFWLSDKVLVPLRRLTGIIRWLLILIRNNSGRKWALILADVIFLIGSIIQTTSAINTMSLTQLYVGRFVGGFGVGLISAVVPTYVGENANREIRGRCIGCMQLFNVTGIMLSYFVNYGVSRQITDVNNSAQWRIPFALQMVPGLLLLLVGFQNESPRWLVEKNRLAEAKTALSHVRGLPEDHAAVNEELDEIVADFEGKDRLSLGMQVKAACSSKKMFYQTSFGVILMFWQQWTGTNSINYYSP